MSDDQKTALLTHNIFELRLSDLSCLTAEDFELLPKKNLTGFCI